MAGESKQLVLRFLLGEGLVFFTPFVQFQILLDQNQTETARDRIYLVEFSDFLHLQNGVETVLFKIVEVGLAIQNEVFVNLRLQRFGILLVFELGIFEHLRNIDKLDWNDSPHHVVNFIAEYHLLG